MVADRSHYAANYHYHSGWKLRKTIRTRSRAETVPAMFIMIWSEVCQVTNERLALCIRRLELNKVILISLIALLIAAS